ncbi:hypothetical protein Shyhy01_02880 [Streptomyces hygroscopicus subsp. hygroscopicus]|nr:hypothetical protein Shyhy01_02880 [Streptomyces hygroscopicus subsp. hygroscopicus]
MDARDEIRFARFTEDWLAPRRGPDPVTPEGDAVRLPYRASPPLGTKDFAASLLPGTRRRPGSSRCWGWAGQAPASRRCGCAGNRRTTGYRG